ncbi:MAG: hypothetical protein KF812_00735 [Fimbriimonadaceae bacterium]|nr:hypothetical protein [Fimbriimonadaceae bacterium]
MINTTITNHLRPDWLRDLAGRLGASDGKIEPTEEQKSQLKRLQDSAEQFEAVFVKKLISDMRKSMTSGSNGPMADLANDFLDDTLSKAVSSGPNGFGLARNVFLATSAAYLRTIPTPTTETNING